MKLLVGRLFKPGDLLTITLPVSEESYSVTVLACVVHVKELPEGEYALGCNFARELSEDDLRSFAVAKTQPALPDQRAWERVPGTVQARYTLVTDRFTPRQAARVVNLSARGVALLVDQEIPAGTLLSAELQADPHAQPLTILVCVVHVSARAQQWVLGCDFIHHLPETELKALCAGSAECSSGL
jgi:hypothetical protein